MPASSKIDGPAAKGCCAGAAATGVEAACGAGIANGLLHLGHCTVRPARWSPAAKLWPHRHVTGIGTLLLRRGFSESLGNHHFAQFCQNRKSGVRNSQFRACRTYVMTTTHHLPGPCTPVVSSSSISPVLLGPVIRTALL